jgi:hypothetical protein
MHRATPNLRHLLALALVLLCTQLTGCFTVAHAVLDSAIQGAAEANMTPETMGISTSQYRGFDCRHLGELERNFVGESNSPANDAMMRKAMGWHVDAIRQVRQEQGCGGASATAGTAGTAAVAAGPAGNASTTFYFYCYATDMDPKVRKTVASTVFEQSVPAMDPMARFNYVGAAEEEFKRNVVPQHGVPDARATCAVEDTLAKANSSRARYRGLFSGFNLTFIDLAWRPVAKAVASAAPAAGAPPAGQAGAGDSRGARGALGIRTDAVSDSVGRAMGLQPVRGALVVELEKGAAAGLKPLDVVLEVAGQPVNQPADLSAIVARMRPGFKAPLRVWRDRALHDVVVEVGSRAQFAGAAAAPGTAPAAPASVVAPVAAAPVALDPADVPGKYCVVFMMADGSVGKPVDVASTVWETRAENDVPALKAALSSFVAHMRSTQPGVWHADFNAPVCYQDKSGYCQARAVHMFGTSQDAYLRCGATRRELDARFESELRDLLKTDPAKAQRIAWKPQP